MLSAALLRCSAVSSSPWRRARERREAGPGTEPGRDWPQDWRLLARLQANDAKAVAEEWTDLLPPTQKLLDALREARRTGEVPDDLVADERQCVLLERINPSVRSASNKRFNGWIGVRTVIRAVRQMHRALLAPSVSKREVRITAAEYTEAMTPLITRALEAVQQALEDLAIAPDDIDSVLMIGGTSQIPQVRHALGELLGHDRIVDSGLCRPMTAVARGAAIYAAPSTANSATTATSPS